MIGNVMKKSVKCFIIISVLIVMLAVMLGYIYISQSHKFYLSPSVCNLMLGESDPANFCANKGKGTWLENKYIYASVDDNGYLVLILSDKVTKEWKNSFYELRILQCILGSERDIGVDINYSSGDKMMELAHGCGYEISDDYTQFIESPGDTRWYSPLIMSACIKMQFFEKKPCDDITVEFLVVNNNGEIIERFIYSPDIGTVIRG